MIDEDDASDHSELQLDEDDASNHPELQLDEDDASNDSELQRQLQAMGLTSGIKFDKEEFDKHDADSVVSLGDASYVKDLVGQRDRRDQERREEIMEDAKDQYLAAIKEQGIAPNESLFLDIYDDLLRTNANRFEEEDAIQDERLLAALEEIANRPPEDDSWKLDAAAMRQKRIEDEAKKREAITRRNAWELERQRAILSRKKNEEARRGAWENAQAKEASESQRKMDTFEDEIMDDNSNVVALQFRREYGNKPDPIAYEEIKAERRKAQKKWILLFVVIFFVIAVVAILFALLGGNDDDPKKVLAFQSDRPTTSSPTIAPSTRPPTVPTSAPVFATLMPTVTESETPTVFTPEAIVNIIYDMLIPNGMAGDIAASAFIPDLIASMDILAPQVWLEANAAAGTRFLAETTVQSPSSISDVVEIACPDSIFVRGEDRCDRVTAVVVLIVEAGKAAVEATFLSAITAATNDGRFQETLEKVNPDIDITIFRDNEIPARTSLAPTISTSPTSAPTTSTMPSAQPSISLAPSTSFQPSFRPSVSLTPSLEPTENSAPPSTIPSVSVVPSAQPSAEPSPLSSSQPTPSPSLEPTENSAPPTTLPSVSVVPTISAQPSAEPSPLGASQPTPSPGLFVFMQCEDETQNCCNGLDTICDLRVDEIFYASVHNAMATSEDGNSFVYNHQFKLEGALEAGYRGINLDVCNCDGEYQLCHGICNFGARYPAETFGSINQFLDQNPTETILITLEINSGVDKPVDLDAFYSILSGVDGLVDKIYIHQSVTDPLPTLREMVAANTRLMIFFYNGATTCAAANDCPPGFHYWFEFAGETEYSFSSVSDVLDTTVSCEVTRGSANNPFFAINSFVTLPSQTDATTLNSLSSAKTRLETCSSLNDSADVNIIFADFWSEGELPELAQQHNAALVSRRQRHMLRVN